MLQILPQCIFKCNVFLQNAVLKKANGSLKIWSLSFV